MPGQAADLDHPSGFVVQRLLGFWVLWHSFGGVGGMVQSGAVSKSGAYAQRKQFRHVFGCDVADWMPKAAAAIARAPLFEELSGEDGGRGVIWRGEEPAQAAAS